MRTIYEGERAFLLKNGKIEKILNPGKYNIFDIFGKYEIVKQPVNSINPEYNGEFKENLINQNKELIEENFYNFDIGETEIGILYKNGKIYELLKGSENYLFWKGFGEFTCEIIDISENVEVEKNYIKKFKTISNNFNNAILQRIVADYEKAILKINGEFRGIINSGEYMFYNSLDKIEIFAYDMRVINLNISGQEILTKDKIGVRINLSLYYSIDDLEKFYKTYASGLDFISIPLV